MIMNPKLRLISLLDDYKKMVVSPKKITTVKNANKFPINQVKKI